MKDRDPVYRKNAVHALNALLDADRSVLPVLVEALVDPYDNVALCALQGLKDAGKKAVAPLLVAVKKAAPQHQGRFSAAFRLIGPEARAAVPTLLGLLKGPDEYSRAAAAAALGSVTGREYKPDPRVVPALAERIKKGGPQERYAAAWALGRIGPNARTAVPALIELLKDEQQYDLPGATAEHPDFGRPFGMRGYQPSVLAHIPAAALGNIGPDARAALPALRKIALRQVIGCTEAAAREALQQIEPGPPKGPEKPAPGDGDAGRADPPSRK
jgi:hypothetical protein